MPDTTEVPHPCPVLPIFSSDRFSVSTLQAAGSRQQAAYSLSFPTVSAYEKERLRRQAGRPLDLMPQAYQSVRRVRWNGDCYFNASRDHPRYIAPR